MSSSPPPVVWHDPATVRAGDIVWTARPIFVGPQGEERPDLALARWDGDTWRPVFDPASELHKVFAWTPIVRPAAPVLVPARWVDPATLEDA